MRENQHFDKTYKQKSFTFQLRTQSLYIPSPHPTLYHLAHTHTHTNLQRTFILLKVIHFEMVEAYLSMCVCVPHLTREIHKTFRKLSGCNGLLSFPFFLPLISVRFVWHNGIEIARSQQKLTAQWIIVKKFLIFNVEFSFLYLNSRCDSIWTAR